MYTVDQRDALRLKLLEALYETDEGQPNGWLEYDVWAEDAGIDQTEVERASLWLVDHGLADLPSMGPVAGITSQGRDEVEERRRTRAAPSTALDVLTIPEFRRLEKATGAVETLLADHGEELDAEDRDDLRAQLDTIDAQKRSPRPRKGVVGAALVVILYVLNAATQGLIEHGTIELLETITKAFGF